MSSIEYQTIAGIKTGNPELDYLGDLFLLQDDRRIAIVGSRAPSSAGVQRST